MTLKIGQFLSGDLIRSSIFLCKLAKEIEIEYRKDWDNQTINIKRNAYLSFVLGSISLTGAFLDSKINELLFEIWNTENPSNLMQKKIPHNNIERFKIKNKNLKGLSRKSIEIKYRKTLELILDEDISRISLPQDLTWFVFIRNRTLHYEFEWLDVSDPNSIKSDKYDKLEIAVQSKFSNNIFSDPSELFFPIQCLGYGCAYWGIQTSLSFMEDFYKKIDIEYPLTLPKFSDLYC